MTESFDWDENVIGYHTPDGFVKTDDGEDEPTEEKTDQRTFPRGYNA